MIDINYAKAAKRIDIKKLKGTMWKLLTTKEDIDKVSCLYSVQSVSRNKIQCFSVAILIVSKRIHFFFTRCKYESSEMEFRDDSVRRRQWRMRSLKNVMV